MSPHDWKGREFWFEVDCPCRDDGPWPVLGPADARVFPCARCGEIMSLRMLEATS